jgi:hypothetical protein
MGGVARRFLIMEDNSRIPWIYLCPASKIIMEAENHA